MLLGHTPRRMGHGDLEDGLCEIDSDARSVHVDSSPGLGLRGRFSMCWHIGAVSGEESIPSVAAAQPSGKLARGARDWHSDAQQNCKVVSSLQCQSARVPDGLSRLGVD